MKKKKRSEELTGKFIEVAIFELNGSSAQCYKLFTTIRVIKQWSKNIEDITKEEIRHALQ